MYCRKGLDGDGGRANSSPGNTPGGGGLRRQRGRNSASSVFASVRLPADWRLFEQVELQPLVKHLVHDWDFTAEHYNLLGHNCW